MVVFFFLLDRDRDDDELIWWGVVSSAILSSQFMRQERELACISGFSPQEGTVCFLLSFFTEENGKLEIDAKRSPSIAVHITAGL